MEFTAFPRSMQGTGASRRLRRAGKVPGIVYGVGAPASIEVDHNALFHALKSEKFHSSILSMRLDGRVEKVLLRDVQRHPYKLQVLHVDFQRVDETSKIHMRVPLHFVNAEISPAVKLSAATISHVAQDLEVSCMAKDLPEFVEVDLTNLAAGGSIHVSDLKLPAGVTVIVHGQDKNPVVAYAAVPRGAVEETVEVAAVAAADVPTTAQKVPEKTAEPKAGEKEKGGKK